MHGYFYFCRMSIWNRDTAHNESKPGTLIKTEFTWRDSSIPAITSPEKLWHCMCLNSVFIPWHAMKSITFHAHPASSETALGYRCRKGKPHYQAVSYLSISLNMCINLPIILPPVVLNFYKRVPYLFINVHVHVR